MRWLFLIVALLGASVAIAATPCDTRAPTAMADLGEVRLAYQSIGRESDPALLLVMGLGGQLIDWPDEVLGSLCQAGWRVIRFDNRDVGLSRLKGGNLTPASPTRPSATAWACRSRRRITCATWRSMACS